MEIGDKLWKRTSYRYKIYLKKMRISKKEGQRRRKRKLKKKKRKRKIKKEKSIRNIEDMSENHLILNLSTWKVTVIYPQNKWFLKNQNQVIYKVAKNLLSSQWYQWLRNNLVKMVLNWNKVRYLIIIHVKVFIIIKIREIKELKVKFCRVKLNLSLILV